MTKISLELVPKLCTHKRDWFNRSSKGQQISKGKYEVVALPKI